MITPDASPVIALRGEQAMTDVAIQRLEDSRAVRTILLNSADWLVKLRYGLKADFLLIDLDREIDPFSAVRMASELFPGWVLVASDQCDMMDRVLAYEAGAHAFFGKPLEPREVLAKVRSLHRRTAALKERAATADAEAETVLGGVRFDFAHRTATAEDGRRIHFTGSDWSALEILAENPTKPVSRRELSERVFAREWVPEDRAIDKLILRLRRRLREVGGEPEAIQTVRNRGYAAFPGGSGRGSRQAWGGPRAVLQTGEVIAFEH